MSQKRNKIIMLVGVILIIILVFFVIKHYNQLTLSKRVVSEQPAEILNRDCVISDESLVNICSYSLFNKAIPLGSVDFNPQDPAALKSGDFIIVKLNPRALFINSELYKDVRNKLMDKFNLCFQTSVPLEEQQFVSNKNLLTLSKTYFCLPNLTKDSNEIVAFTGYVPYPINKSKFSMLLWSVRDESLKNQSQIYYIDTSQNTLLYIQSYNIKD